MISIFINNKLRKHVIMLLFQNHLISKYIHRIYSCSPIMTLKSRFMKLCQTICDVQRRKQNGWRSKSSVKTRNNNWMENNIKIHSNIRMENNIKTRSRILTQNNNKFHSNNRMENNIKIHSKIQIQNNIRIHIRIQNQNNTETLSRTGINNTTNIQLSNPIIIKTGILFMAEFVIQEMTGNDIDAVLELDLICFSAPWNREIYEKEVNENDFAHYFIIKTDEKVIGYVGLWLVLEDAQVTNIAIAPEYRGYGI